MSDRLGWWMLWLLIVLTMMVNLQQSEHIRDLQRRVGQLEQQVNR